MFPKIPPFTPQNKHNNNKSRKNGQTPRLFTHFFSCFDLAKNAMFYRIALIPWLGTVADWNLEQNPSCWTEPWLNFVRHWIYPPPRMPVTQDAPSDHFDGFPRCNLGCPHFFRRWGVDPSYAISLGEIFEDFSPKFQLMITWIKLVVWDSNRVPLSNNPFTVGSQMSKLPNQITNSPLAESCLNHYPIILSNEKSKHKGWSGLCCRFGFSYLSMRHVKYDTVTKKQLSHVLHQVCCRGRFFTSLFCQDGYTYADCCGSTIAPDCFPGRDAQE